MNRLFIFFTYIWLTLPVLVSGQQVRVLSENLEFNGDLGSTQTKTIILQNDSDQFKTFFLKNLKGNIGTSQNIKICIGDQCFNPRKDLSKVKLTLNPGEIVTDMYLDFDMGIAGTRGAFDLIFMNESNFKDVFVVKAVYEVKNSKTKVNEFDYKDMILSDIYPNPGNRIAQLDYEYKNPKVKAKITINSFIGNPIAEYELDPGRSTLLINISEYNPGFYFYTLFLDNKNIVTKKLQVKK